MRRIVLVVTLMLGAVVFSYAQDAQPEGPDDGSPGLVVRGVTADMPLADLILLTSEHADMVFLYDPKKVMGETTLVAPRSGVKYGKEEYPMLLQNMLEEFRLCFMPKGDVWVIIPQVEAVTLAPHLTVEELATADDAHWVVVHVELKSLDANSATGALRNLVSRQGGMVNPVQPNALLICDRVDRLKEVVRTAVAMDKAATPVITRYALPEGTHASDAVEALQQLFPSNRGAAQTFASAPSGEAVLARATPADQAQIAQAIEAMK